MSESVPPARADDIRRFRNEVARLEAEGVLTLDEATATRLRAHHEALLSGANEAPQAQGAGLSTGMRIATLLGAIALSVAYALLIDSMWGRLNVMVQLAVVVVPPVVLVVATHVAAVRDPTRYIAAIISSVAVVAFAVNLIVIGSLFNVPDSRQSLLAVGAFGLTLAYGYGLALPLVLGIAGVGGWLWSLAAVPAGRWWTTGFESFEPLVAVGIFSMLVAGRIRHPAAFTTIYRGLGAGAVAIALLILGQFSRASALPIEVNRVVQGIYQVTGAAVFGWMIVTGVRRDRPDLVRVGTGAAILFLFLRLADWFWVWLPKWLFFLIVGGAAVVVVLVLRRARAARAEVT